MSSNRIEYGSDRVECSMCGNAFYAGLEENIKLCNNCESKKGR